MLKSLFVFVVMFVSVGVYASGTQWIYNYSNLPVVPIVAPQYNYQSQYYQQYNQQPVVSVQQYNIPGYTVIQSGGQQVICSTIGQMVTCY